MGSYSDSEKLHSDHPGMDFPLNGSILVNLSSRPKIIHADNEVLSILGFEHFDLDNDGEIAKRKLESVYPHILEQILKGFESVSNERYTMGACAVDRIDGARICISRWGKWEGFAEERNMRLSIVLEDSADRYDLRASEDIKNLEIFAGDTVDLIINIDTQRKVLVCTKNNLESPSSIPVGLPLAAEDVIELWIENYICDEFQEVARDLCSVETLIRESGINQCKLDINLRGNRVPGSILTLSWGSKSLIVVRLLDVDRTRGGRSEAGVFIRTFGSFEIFKNGEPVVFKNKKAKEYLALLVDRRGSYVSSKEAFAILWPNVPMGENALARARKAAMNMKRTLEKEGIEDIVEADGSARRLVASKINCDLFDYLRDPENSEYKFRGSYLPEYDWGETTLGELTFLEFE